MIKNTDKIMGFSTPFTQSLIHGLLLLVLALLHSLLAARSLSVIHRKVHVFFSVFFLF